MADSIVEEVTKQVVENLTQSDENGTTKGVPSTPEGMLIAYSSLFLMALIPVFIGSFKSIKYQEAQKAAGEPIETMSSRDAAIFPIIASCALFGLYIVFKIFSKDYVNMLLSFYFLLLGVFAMTHVFSPIVKKFIPSVVPLYKYELVFKKVLPDGAEGILDERFSTHDIIVFLLCCVIGVWYFIEKHWLANNMLGMAFAINGIELLALSSTMTGTILLGLLFVYDIFWVFGTNVMVTVAKNFDAPIKLVFPQDLLENGLAANKFAMLGLGDIVIPGIFVALLLRFDKSLNRGTHHYFYAGYFAYIFGLLATMLVLHVFKAAQPALLYLVPACVGFPTLLSCIKGDFVAFYTYGDTPQEKDVDHKEVKEDGEEGEEEISKRITRAEAKKAA